MFISKNTKNTVTSEAWLYSWLVIDNQKNEYKNILWNYRIVCVIWKTNTNQNFIRPRQQSVWCIWLAFCPILSYATTKYSFLQTGFSLTGFWFLLRLKKEARESWLITGRWQEQHTGLNAMHHLTRQTSIPANRCQLAMGQAFLRRLFSVRHVTGTCLYCQHSHTWAMLNVHLIEKTINSSSSQDF